MDKTKKTGILLSLLNQPFILWFMSTVILGTTSFLYTQFKEQTFEEIQAIKQKKTARLELGLIIIDIKNKVNLKDKMNLFILTQINNEFSYFPEKSQLKGLRNILIELDGATGLSGIEKFNPIISKKMTILNNASYRLNSIPVSQQQGPVWSNMTTEEKDNIIELDKLTDDILEFYAIK